MLWPLHWSGGHWRWTLRWTGDGTGIGILCTVHWDSCSGWDRDGTYGSATDQTRPPFPCQPSILIPETKIPYSLRSGFFDTNFTHLMLFTSVFNFGSCIWYCVFNIWGSVFGTVYLIFGIGVFGIWDVIYGSSSFPDERRHNPLYGKITDMWGLTLYHAGFGL